MGTLRPPNPAAQTYESEVAKEEEEAHHHHHHQDAGALFVLKSKGNRSHLSNFSLIFCEL